MTNRNREQNSAEQNSAEQNSAEQNGAEQRGADGNDTVLPEAEHQVEDRGSGSSSRLPYSGFLFASFPLGIIYIDSERILGANASAARILGLSISQLEGREPADPRWLATDEEGQPLPRHRHPVLQALITGEEVRSVVVAIHHPGWDEQRWVQVDAVPEFRPGADRPFRAYGVFHDITELRRTQEALRRTQARFEVALEAPAITLAICDRDLRYTWIHSPHPDFDSEQILGARDDELGPPDRMHPWIEFKRRVLENEAPQREVLEAMVSDGPHFYDVHGQPVRDEEGRVIGVSTASVDVTEKVRAERRIAEEGERLKEQGAVIDQAQDAIIIRDLDHTIRFWNKGAERLYDYSSEEVVGRPIDRFLHSDHEAFSRANEAVLSQGQWRGELELKRRDGTTAVVDGRWSLLRREDGSPYAILAIHTDVSERIQLEDKLRQAQKMEAVGRLAGGIAHDFNNLLTVISGRSELLGLEIPIGTDARESVEEISDAAAKAGSLTAQLLAFSRRQIVQPRVIVLRDIVRGMDKLLRRVIGEDVELVLIDKDGTVPILADPTQIEQVILNLAMNARDAMPLGGMLTISVESVQFDEPLSLGHSDLSAGRYVVLSVRDTGSGIPREVQPHVFDPFFTTKEKGKGTGLGLATVYGVVQQTGGGIQLDSVAGRGTSISVYLPVVEPAVMAELQAEAPGEVGGERPEEEREKVADHEPKTILIVEDDMSVRTLLARLLPRLGYKALEARDGTQALQLLGESEETIALVLTDVIMPVMSGTVLASHLERDHPDLPIVFMSGYMDDVLAKQDALEEGILLRKPFTAQELARSLKEALRVKASDQG